MGILTASTSAPGPFLPPGASTSAASAGEAFLEDFSSYGATSNFIADDRNIYFSGAHDDASHMVIDTNEGLDIDGYSLSQALRYDYPNRPNACNGYRIQRDIRWSQPGATGIAKSEHVWVEAYVKFSSSYDTIQPSTCSSANSQKLLFQTIDNNSTGAPAGRWDIRAGTQDGNNICVGVPNDGNSATFGGKDDCKNYPVFDGTWHKYQFEAKVPTTPDSNPSVDDGSGDGVLRLWIDDKLEFEATDVFTASTILIGVTLGSNINHGPVGSQSYWWGRVAAWTTDPGW